MPSDTDVHAAETTIDVRTIPPWERHALIFRTFDELPSGGTLQLVNDHDPAPLRAQFESRHAGTFRWDYAESGPDVWRVRIGKTERVCCGGCHGFRDHRTPRGTTPASAPARTSSPGGVVRPALRAETFIRTGIRT